MPVGNPKFLKRNPATGLVTNEFDGHISADGIDLPSLFNTDTADTHISWHKDTKTGAEVAQVYGMQTSGKTAGASQGYIMGRILDTGDGSNYNHIIIGTSRRSANLPMRRASDFIMRGDPRIGGGLTGREPRVIRGRFRCQGSNLAPNTESPALGSTNASGGGAIFIHRDDIESDGGVLGGALVVCGMLVDAGVGFSHRLQWRFDSITLDGAGNCTDIKFRFWNLGTGNSQGDLYFHVIC